MEDVIAVYHLPYDPDYPQVCMDESCKQLIGEVHEAIACVPGKPKRMDAEYVRNGVAQIFLEVEPLTGKRHVEAAQHRTRKDWAVWIKGMLDKRYPKAVRVRLVLDNLNTHCLASLYETFKPQEARRLAERLEIHYTPKHGSWLNMAEIELSGVERTEPGSANSRYGSIARPYCRMGKRPEQPASKNSMAVLECQGAHKAEAPLSPTLSVTWY